MIKPQKTSPAAYGAENLAELWDVTFKPADTYGIEAGEKRAICFNENTIDQFQLEIIKKDIEVDNESNIIITNKFSINPVVQFINSTGEIVNPTTIVYLDDLIDITFSTAVTGILKLR